MPKRLEGYSYDRSYAKPPQHAFPQLLDSPHTQNTAESS